MTEEQCATCAKPTKMCQSPQFAHLMSASCLNHTPCAIGEVPFMQARVPFEQVKIENHDSDHTETLLHMDGCGCPACVRMVNRGYVKIGYEWRMKCYHKQNI